MVGKDTELGKLGLGQVSYFIDPQSDNSGLSVASSYGYQSLMLFRIINQVPLDFADARVIMRYLMSGIIILIVQHPDETTSDKYLQLAATALVLRAINYKYIIPLPKTLRNFGSNAKSSILLS